MKITLTLKRIERPGELVFLPPQDMGLQEAIRKVLRTCRDKHNDYVKQTIEPPYKPRTTGPKSQNHRINGFIQQICMATGLDFADVKMYCKIKAVSMGYPTMKDDDGETIMSIVTGIPIPESETNIDTREAGILSDAVEHVAAELGVFLQE